MIHASDLMSIGEVAERSGLAPSALRHYETLGLIAAERTAGGHRMFRRGVLRRLAAIRAGQRVGLGLEEIRDSFGALDPHVAPTKTQWRVISKMVCLTTPGITSPLSGGVISSLFPSSLIMKTKTDASFKPVISSSLEWSHSTLL